MHHQSTDFGDHVQRVIGGAKAKTVDEVFDLSQAADLRIPTKAPCCNEMMPPPVTE
jgi:hypothetical protein